MKTLDFEQAVQAINKGDLVAFATETVFGLGADASQDKAVARIYTVKGRPSFNPLIVHVGNVAHASRLALWNDRAAALASLFWPGPLTLVLPLKDKAKLSAIVTAGARTVAVRCPADDQARDLAARIPMGIAAPSANKSGQLSPSREKHVRKSFVNFPEIGFLPGSIPVVGLESTVIDLSNPKAQILRHGGITQAQIERIIGPVHERPTYLEEDFADKKVSSPGQLRSHYAPSIPLFLNQSSAAPGHGLLAFGPKVPDAPWIYNLSSKGDVVEAASRLFEGLHVLSASGAQAISAMPVPNTGIGAAINDRLRRGAA